MFRSILMAETDPVLGLLDIYKNDQRKNKINLGIGVYTDKINDAPVLVSVKSAEKLLLKEELSKNYLSIEGMESFNFATQELLFGQTNDLINKDRIRTVQAIGGTGALRIIAEFISRNSAISRTIWVSNPSWVNHKNIFSSSGLVVRQYPYYDSIKNALDFEKLYSTMINQVKSGDIVLFHGCCHNPTGVDPTVDQWKILSDCSEKNGWIPLFDLAYQGFAYDLKHDLKGLHIFCKNNPELIVCNSYSKNFGLYNERIGACTIIADTNSNAEKTLSQLRSIIRASYSNPPNHGAAIVSTILSNLKLRRIWEDELKNIREQIQDTRILFLNNLQKSNLSSNTKDFSFIKNQKGMFAFMGLNVDQVLILRKQFGIYLVGNGRINLAGLSKDNIPYVCNSIQNLFILN